MYKSSSGMKRDRLGDSNSPPNTMSKRSRSSTGGGSLGRYNDGANNDSSDENGSPPPDSRTSRSASDRHHQGRSAGRSSSRNLSPRGGARNYNNDDQYIRPSGGYKDGGSSRGHGHGHHTGGAGAVGSAPPAAHPLHYKVLCISNLHPKASDEVIRDTLYREFKRFGDISVKVVHEPEERLAFVYFRSAEDAREAKHSKSRIIIYDKPVVVEAAYESTPTTPNYSRSNSSHHSPPPPSKSSHHHDYESNKMYRRSPVYENTRGGGGRSNHPDDHRSQYDRYDRSSAMAPPQGPPPPMHYRSDGGGYNRGGGGGGAGRDGNHMHHDYVRGGGALPPAPGMHYSRYPPGGGAPMGANRGIGGHHMGGRSTEHNMPHHQSMEPPPHMGPPVMGGAPGPGGPGGPGGPRSYENKKDKFPNYLHHLQPEDDPLATRTLFAGNLEVNITDEELRRIFGRYGTVEDIDIKRPPPGTGNAYAFVRYVNLDMASRAKCELSGQYIGKFQCKIGYGKVNATTKIWVGGLGPWTTLSMLEREFDRFGSIKKIEWAKGEQNAYITYETIDAAQAAVKDMRGYPLGGPDKRLRTDFADAGAPLIAPIPGAPPFKSYKDSYEGGADAGPVTGGGDYDYNRQQNFNRGGPQAGSRSFSRNSREDLREAGDAPTGRSGPGSTHSGGTDLGTSPGNSDSESAAGGDRPRNGAGLLSAARGIPDICRRAALGWQGALILKNSSFPTKLYMTEGDLEGVELLMKDEEGKTQLRITQRLRLDQTKLDDVVKRIQGSTAHGVFLAVPGASNSSVASPGESDSGAVQSRPLRNLVSYLKQKEAAGVISLVNAKDATLTGVLYAFPPCSFSWDLLKKNCPSLIVDNSTESLAKEDHLVIVVIRGGTA